MYINIERSGLLQDSDYMNLALSLAKATKGQTSPNPQVGAVIVKNGCILGTGAHLQAGSAHAEVHAIKAAGHLAKDADLYVTLEPCSHVGKTSSCVEAIKKAGIRKVFIATEDPNPKVSGKGIAILKQAGIEVETGLLEEEAKEMNKEFFHFIRKKIPFVTMKAAVSLDGKIAAATGDSKWITSPESRQNVHQLRHEHDAILVGIHTTIHDNPQLTTRLPQGGKNPIRVILDTHLRIPLDANVVTDEASSTIIYSGNAINQQKATHLQNQPNVEVVSFPSESVHLKDVLTDLGRRNVMTLLVEGGATVHASFVETKTFDEIVVYMAPKVIGGKEASSFVEGRGVDLVEEATNLQFTNVEQIGQDMKITAKPIRKELEDVYWNSGGTRNH